MFSTDGPVSKEAGPSREDVPSFRIKHDSLAGASFRLQRGSESAATHPVMRHQLDRIAVLDAGVLARDTLVDGHHQLLLLHELYNFTQDLTVFLDQLPDGGRFGDVTGEVALAISGLQLPHERDGDHSLDRREAVSNGG